MGKVISFLAATCCLLSPCAAQEPKGLDIALISENTTISPGSTFHVGLHIKHQQGFHTYWKGPGIVGMATAIEWKLPPGFTASPIQWPYPEITSMAGHPCHGYERDVTLIIPITAPKNLTGKSTTLTASTRWMCCAKNCYPGFQDFTITLPIGTKSTIDPKTTPLFQKARAELPSNNPPWHVAILTKTDSLTIKLRFRPKENTNPVPEYLFSEDGQISSDKKQIFAVQTDGSYILEVARSEFSPKNKSSLPAVIKSGKNYYQISPAYPQSP